MLSEPSESSSERTAWLDRRLALDPQVALRPEPFGALAYHYGNRRLIFLKHPDVVRVVRSPTTTAWPMRSAPARSTRPAGRRS
jgi:putative mycofactocin binding protein MftB